MKNLLFITFALILSFPVAIAQVNPKLQNQIESMALSMESKVIGWRRHFHQYPELSNREFNTAKKIAEHLRALGLDVTTEVAKTGVVGILKGGKNGPVIALRADMDALPVMERNALPFASKEKAVFNGQETGVMHACGHDTHVAILMGVAEILSKVKKDLKGTVKFIFQPAEEGPPAGEEGGAELMVKEGVLENPKVDVVFGLHIWGISRLGKISYKPGGMMAASDWFTIKVYGKQAHGAFPWKGVDPIVVSAQIINSLQTLVSRQMNLTQEAAVVTVGTIHAGIRENIIPEYAEMSGTIRTLDRDMRKDLLKSMEGMVTHIAESAGARAELIIEGKTPVTYNDPVLTGKMEAALVRAAGKENVALMHADTGAEDFAFFQEKVPGLYIFVGACPPDVDPDKAPSHHTPDFMIDEKAMLTGLKAMLNLTLEYMFNP